MLGGCAGDNAVPHERAWTIALFLLGFLSSLFSKYFQQDLIDVDYF
jgi:hypothetical protein